MSSHPSGAEMHERDASRPVLITGDDETLATQQDAGLPFIGNDGHEQDELQDQTNNEVEDGAGEPPNDVDLPTIDDEEAVGHETEQEVSDPLDDLNEFVFDPASERVVAQFEFNGNAMDMSGESRDGILLGGHFVDTAFGQGLRVGDSEHGFDWSRYSFFLRHPYTVEIVLSPDAESATFSKLLGHDDTDEGGWYLYSAGFRTYPIQGGTLGSEMMAFGQRAYLAVVSTSDTEVHVFINGEQVTDEPVPSQYPRDPQSAIFFRDDASPSRYETLHAVIDAMRISSVSRSAADIALVQNRLGGE